MCVRAAAAESLISQIYVLRPQQHQLTSVISSFSIIYFRDICMILMKDRGLRITEKPTLHHELFPSSMSATLGLH
jgi:hypothetical protein